MTAVTEMMIVRHAQSVWNAERRWQGWADPPLSALGEEQATSAARVLAAAVGAQSPPALVASSDLQRARRTAELLAAGAWGPPADRPVRYLVDPDLREYDAGDWTGLRREEIQERWPAELAAWVAGDLDRAPGGEDNAVFEARLLGAVDRIGRAETDGWVLAVSHGRAVHALATALGGPSGHVDHLTGWRVQTGPPPELLAPVALLGDRARPARIQDL